MFLQTDPVAGGSCNDYDYVCQDPVNGLDLAGTTCWTPSCVVSHAVRKTAHLAKTAYKQTIRAVAVVPYAVYYGGYHMNKWAARNQPVTWLVRPFGSIMQAAGIAGDAGLDGVKGVTGFKESVWDEHEYGNMNPFHGPNAPKTTFLPGLHGSAGHPRLDFAW